MVTVASQIAVALGASFTDTTTPEISESVHSFFELHPERLAASDDSMAIASEVELHTP